MAVYEIVVSVNLEVEVLVEANSEEEALREAENLSDKVKYVGSYPAKGGGVCSCGVVRDRDLSNLPTISDAFK